MAQFRGTLEGQRGMASRLGSKSTGLVVTCNGWNAGVRVIASHDDATGRDRFTVIRTGGSNNRGQSEIIAEFTDGEPASSDDNGTAEQLRKFGITPTVHP